MQTEGMFAVKRKKWIDKQDVDIVKTMFPNMRASIALSMVERWGLVAANDDGEDSAGRQKLRLGSPEELVQRACETADKLVDEFENRNWLLKIPAEMYEHGEDES